jgi:organic radical activating enzyme
MENRIASYTAASVFPAKILVNQELMREITEEKKIPPIHVQLNPTNRCNMNCPFCSCSARDKRLELSYDEIIDIMIKTRRAGCKSVTITGGGEPLMHPRIFDIIREIKDMGMEIGLVTNGLLLGEVPMETFSRMTWIRISSGDHRSFRDRYQQSIKNAVERGRNVDWSFSHVVARKPNYETIGGIIRFANENAFTHVRLVSDLLDLEASRDMESIRHKLRQKGIDDKLVIYQGRKSYTHGSPKCLISLLKPVVGADGYLYPCCGTQYALETPGRDYEKTMRMGPARDIDKLYEMQKCFDGSVCVRCYYSDYNKALEILLSDIKHKVFV